MWNSKYCSLGEGHYNLSLELDLPACDYVDVEQLEGLRPNKYDLSVLQLNIRGLLNKQGQLRDIMNNGKTDVALLCETWLNKETEAMVSLDNYKFFSIPRKSRSRRRSCYLHWINPFDPDPGQTYKLNLSI